MEFNTERIKPRAEEMTKIIRREFEDQEGYTERAIEHEIRQQLHELGGQMFGMGLS